MRACLKNTVAGSLAALALGLGLASIVTPASAWYRGGGFHGGFHGCWRGGYVGWRGGYGRRGRDGWGGGDYAGWRGGCGYNAWRCGGYWGAAPVVSYAPILAPAPVALVDVPAPAPVVAPACGVTYRPVFDADGTNVGTRAVSICQ